MTGKQSAKESTAECDLKSYDEPKLFYSVADYSEKKLAFLFDNDVLVKFCWKKTNSLYGSHGKEDGIKYTQVSYCTNDWY